MKRYINLLFLSIIFLLLLVSCGDEKEDVNMQESNPEFVQNGIDIYSHNEEVKTIINNLFDSIGYKSIHWIVDKRTKSDRKPDLTNINDYESLIKKLPNVEPYISVKKYADTIYIYRDSIVNNQNDFELIIDRFLSGDFYNKTILAEYDPVKLKDIIQEEEYNKSKAEIDAYIKKQINNSKGELKQAKKRIEEQQKDHQKELIKHKEKEDKSFNPFIKDNWLLLTLLLFSLIFNVFLLISNKKKSQKNKRLKNEITALSNSNFKTQTSNKLISKSEIQQTIDNEYQKLKNRLIQKYQAACFNTQSLKFETLMTQVKENAQNTSFKDKQELLSFIDSQIQKHESSLENELKNCLTRDNAVEEIQASIVAEEFITNTNSNFIPTDELRNKIEQYKNNLVNDLSETISRQQLTIDINNLKRSIEEDLKRIVRANLEIYLPFADSRGSVSDDKRASSANEYSALKLSIDPNDITKATFQLLYNQDEMMRAAIMSYDTLLLPICILKGENFNRNGYKIEQIGPDGTMKLEDGKWRVVNKLEIKVI